MKRTRLTFASFLSQQLSSPQLNFYLRPFGHWSNLALCTVLDKNLQMAPGPTRVLLWRSFCVSSLWFYFPECVRSTYFIQPPQDPEGLACQHLPPGELAGTAEGRQQGSGQNALWEPAGPCDDRRYISGKRREQVVRRPLRAITSCVGILIEKTGEGEVFTSSVISGTAGVLIIVGRWDAGWHWAQICN